MTAPSVAARLLTLEERMREYATFPGVTHWPKAQQWADELAAVRAEQDARDKQYEREVSQFNDGFDAAERGVSYDPPSYPDGEDEDTWSTGWAWAWWLKSRSKRLAGAPEDSDGPEV